jgi:hypothetical protein
MTFSPLSHGLSSASKSKARRSVPDAKISDLFILLHGMLFTNIQLDDFQPTLARFIERLEIEGASLQIEGASLQIERMDSRDVRKGCRVVILEKE